MDLTLWGTPSLIGSRGGRHLGSDVVTSFTLYRRVYYLHPLSDSMEFRGIGRGSSDCCKLWVLSWLVCTRRRCIDKLGILIHIRIKSEVGAVYHFTDASFVDPFCYLSFTFCIIMPCLFLAALWSPAGKGLASMLSCLWCFLVFLLLFHVCLGKVWYLIVSWSLHSSLLLSF